MKGRRPLKDDEVITVINAFKASNTKYKWRDLALFCYGINCGFRISELLSMRIKDVSYNYNVFEYATVKRAFTKGKAEGSTKEVDNWAINYMQLWIDILEKQGYSKTNFIFQSQYKGNRHITRQRANEIIVDICTENKIYGNIGTHSMRKTFTNKMRLFLERLAKNSDIPFSPDEELQKEGRWKTREAMESYLSFRKINFNDKVFDYE